LKVGIAWTGNPEQSRNHERSIPLEKMLTLAEDPTVVLYSFQVGAGSTDIEKFDAGQLIFPLGPEFEQHGLVAAGVAMLEMDLIITVCTSTAHLGGGAGRTDMDPPLLRPILGLDARLGKPENHPLVSEYAPVPTINPRRLGQRAFGSEGGTEPTRRYPEGSARNL
jgi:hypothetical protein